LLGPGAVRAQVTPPAAAAPGPQPVVQASPASEAVNALEIAKGGIQVGGSPKCEATLANAVEQLRQLFTDINFVLTPDVARVKIGDLKLRSVNRPEEALEALRVASGHKFLWKGWPGAGPGMAAMISPATGLPEPNPGAPGEAAALYVLEVAPPGDSPARPNRLVEVFGFSGYKETVRQKLSAEHYEDLQHYEDLHLGGPARREDSRLKLEDRAEVETEAAIPLVQSIVAETLSELTPEAQAEAPSFKFHPGASLLVVIGSPEAIDVASKILTALPGVTHSAQSHAALANPAGEQEAALEASRAAVEGTARRYGRIRGATGANVEDSRQKAEEARQKAAEAMQKRYRLQPRGAAPGAPATSPPPREVPPAPAAPPANTNAPPPAY
jgi:hypothetical protein